MGQPKLAVQHQQPLPSPHLNVEAEIERIRMGGPLLLTDRDTQLHKWLDEQRESGNSGFICSAKGSGVSDSCQYYRMQHVKRKGVLQQLPVPVVYIRVPSICSLSDFYSTVLEALNHPITTGKLRDKRLRTRGRLKSFRTKLLIIDDAEYLTYEAFCELVQIYDTLRIPTVLSGTYNLAKLLRKRYWDRIGNSFLGFYEYPPMSHDEMIAVIDGWETEFLKWPEESDLLLATEFKKIYDKTLGLRDPLNEVLREAAIKSLRQSSYKITAETISSVLSQRAAPCLKPEEE